MGRLSTLVYHQAPETIAQVKAHVPEHLRVRRSGIGLALFLFSATLYLATFAATLLPSLPLWVRGLASVANAIFVAALFIVGHDACHGSLTPNSWLNKLLGRLSFLPSWHPYVCWDLGHNRIHHSWTNLKGRDYVWTPLTPEEFHDLPPTGRLLQRLYRTIPGVGLYYVWEVWVKHMMFPRPSDRKRMSPSLLAADRFAVALFITSQVAISATTATHLQTPVWLSITLAVIVPQFLWNQLMGLVILLHHTHPRVRWYDDPKEWSFFNGQICGTVHVKFPWPVGTILHHIMDHTAHHIDPRIPLYNLPDAQLAVEQSYPSDVIVSPFSLSNLRKVLRECQLYDYTHHQWLPFGPVAPVKSPPDGRLADLMTVEETSQYLRIPPAMVHYLVQRRQLPVVEIDGHRRIKRSLIDLDNLRSPDEAGQPSVLVVDDDPALQSLFNQFLKSADFDRLVVGSGAAAIAAAKKQNFDLVFLDLQLPDLPGDEVYAQLKALHPDLPITVITGYPDSETLSRILSHGPVTVIKKPLEHHQLNLVVRQLAHKGAGVGTGV